jgi:hypothetical protein
MAEEKYASAPPKHNIGLFNMLSHMAACCLLLLRCTTSHQSKAASKSHLKEADHRSITKYFHSPIVHHTIFWNNDRGAENPNSGKNRQTFILIVSSSEKSSYSLSK